MTASKHPMEPTVEERRGWMAILSKADPSALESLWDSLGEKPGHHLVRPAERGAVMVRGRAGGDGAPFNMGEITITRCTARLEDGPGPIGHGYVAGRNPRHAEIAAVLDAMLQTEAHGHHVRALVLEPLISAQDAARRSRAAKIAATKVDFFTLVRGED